jgi:hypothetical protein
MLRETLGKKFDIVSTVKPNTPLANVTEDLDKLGRNLSRRITLS